MLMGKVDGSIPNPETVLLTSFEKYLEGKVSVKVRYEYMRVVKHFLKETVGVSYWLEDPRFYAKIKDFLNIENPYTYRNTLAAMKHLKNSAYL